MGTITAKSQIAPSELQAKLSSGEDVFVLDVRAENEYFDWPIDTSERVKTLNIPYFLYLEDEESVMARLPKDREIVVVCAKGGASDYLVQELRQKGYDAKNLEGGMLAWSQIYDVKRVKEASRGRTPFDLWQINRVAKGCLSYLMGSEGEAMVVDPGRHVHPYLQLAAEHGLVIKHVVDTHLHADHISGGRRLAELTEATYYLPSADGQDVTYPFTPLNEGALIRVGESAIETVGIHTPGHTPGSTSLLVCDELLLTGDLLFVASVGRPDLGGMAERWIHDLHKTLFGRITSLDDSIHIYPGHYGDAREFNQDGIVTATLGDLRTRNPILQITEKDRFVEEILGGMPMQPANFSEIRRVNNGVKDVTDAEATEMEIGPNRCAVSE